MAMSSATILGSGSSGAQEKTYRDAWQALSQNTNQVRNLYEEGMFFFNADGEPSLLEMGATYFQQWESGIRGYGVRYGGFNTNVIKQSYTSSFPKEAAQITEGQWQGAFKDNEGNLIVPGLGFFPQTWNKADAISTLETISNIIKANADESKITLDQVTSFWANHPNGYADWSVFAEALGHKDRGVRWGAIVDLCANQDKIKGADIAAILIEKLKDPAAQVREIAAQNLSTKSDPRAEAPFQQALLHDRNAHVRLWAALALSRFEAKNNSPLLTSIAKDDPSPNVRAAASYSLKKLSVLKPERTLKPKCQIKPYEEVPLSLKVRRELALDDAILSGSFLRTIENYRTLRTKILAENNQEAVRSVDCVLREVNTLRSLALHKNIMIDLEDGYIVFMGLKSVEYLDQGFEGYGLVLPVTGWEPGGTLGAKQFSANSIDDVRKYPVITSGKWAGAYDLGQDKILLPGLTEFRII